jgi:cell division inhibitor SulA
VQSSIKLLHIRKTSCILLKVVITKAFDTMNWLFLLSLLRHLGFSQRWTKWISLVLSSTSTKIILNGMPGRHICHKRELHQGGPLSPLLFVLAMEVLNALFQCAEE